MKALTLAAALAVAALIPTPASAQVSAVIVIGNPPVYGPVYRDSRPRYHDYDYRPTRRVYVDRAPRVIYVKRIHRHRDHRFKHREVRAYYDHHRNVYYDRYRPGLRAVVVFEQGNDYYRYDDDDGYRDDGYRNDD